MGMVEQTMILQALNRLESTRSLLDTASQNNASLVEKISVITSDLEKHERSLNEIYASLRADWRKKYKI